MILFYDRPAVFWKKIECDRRTPLKQCVSSANAEETDASRTEQSRLQLEKR